MRVWFMICVALALTLLLNSGARAKEDGVVTKPGTITIFNAETGRHEQVEKIVKTPEEWKKILPPDQYKVTREHGTERPFCSLPLKKYPRGFFKCADCGTDLFGVEVKFESGTGWPSFTAPVDPANVGYTEDNSLGMNRTEVHCARCGAHLGHVFDDGPPPTHKRYCINSISMKFKALKDNK